MRDNNGSGYKSTCVNEETVDETGLPRKRELAYELSAKWVWAGRPGLGRIWHGLVPAGCLGRAWAARLDASLVRLSSPELLLAGGEKGEEKRRERRKKRKKEEKKRREKREIREKKRGEREEEKNLDARIFENRNSIL